MADFTQDYADAIAASPPQREPGFWDAIYENVVGRGEADTPGEKLGQYIRGLGAGTARGILDVPAIPANLAQLGAAGYDYAREKLGGAAGPGAVSQFLESLPDTREMFANNVPVIGPESSYVAPGTAGKVISTMGEFGGGAGVMAGPSAIARYGLLPGAASETAGQLTEGTPYETPARIGAAVLAPLIAGKITSPFGGADPELIAAAKRARQLGIKPSAGQTVGSQGLQSLEDTLTATPAQLDDLARLAMKTTGSSAPRLTQGALRDTERALGNQFDDILVGVQSTPSQSLAQRALAIVDDYMQDAPSATVTPRVANIAQEIMDAATSNTPKPVSLETFRKWRTSLGSLVTSDDEAARIAARALRDVIDDATDEALRAAGRTGDIAKLATVRRQWWNFIGVKDASSRAGQGARLGRVTPEALRSAVRRTQGPDAISMGRGTDLAELATTAEAAIPSVPTVLAGGVRSLSPEAMAGAAGLASGGLPGMAAGAAAMSGGRAVVNNPLVQWYLRNQQMSGPTARGQMSMLPGILSQIEGAR